MVKVNRTVLHDSVVTVQEFSTGGTVRAQNDYFKDATGTWQWSGATPKQIPAGSTPQSTGGVGKGAWIRVGDTSLRSDLKKQLFWSTPEMFGARGNGIDDDTIPVQMAIDSVNDGTVILKQKYKVTKTSQFSEDFPDGDQPCLYIRDKHGFELAGNGHLIVENHAQGCIEVQRSKHVRINGPKITGAGNFPPVDGMTGLSEKGLPNKGYNTQSFFQVYKNNSYDTAGNSGAGFGGNFPQWGGGVASSWGIWNGGFIGNAGSGILIHNDCDDIEISDCEITGFNFSGVAVGFYGDFLPSNKNYKPSTNIRIHDNKLKGNYNGGVTAMHCDGVTVFANDVNDIGHPDSSWEHENVNPGYGYASLGNDFYPAKKVRIFGNNFKNCKRKGIDAHAGDEHIITGNTIDSSYYQGIFYTWSGIKQNATCSAISGNIISNIKQDGIYIAGLDDENYSYQNIRLDTVVSGNVITNADRTGVYILSGRDVDVSNNIIKRDKLVTGTHYGIYAGNPFNNTRKLYNVNIKDNIIVAEPDSGFYMGISAELMTEGMVTGNNIRNVGGGGIRVTNGSSENIVTGNMVRVGSDQIGVEVNQTGGRSHPNQVIGGNGVNVLNDGRARITLDTIILYVECNGTSSPTVTRRAGGDNVVSVVSSGTGFTINLQGIGSYVKPVATVSGASDFLPINGAGAYCGYMIQRPSTNTQVHIGLKGDGKSPSYMSLASLTAGSFIVRIDLM